MVFWVRCEKMAPEDVKENGVYPKPPKLPNTKKNYFTRCSIDMP